MRAPRAARSLVPGGPAPGRVPGGSRLKLGCGRATPNAKCGRSRETKRAVAGEGCRDPQRRRSRRWMSCRLGRCDALRERFKVGGGELQAVSARRAEGRAAEAQAHPMRDQGVGSNPKPRGGRDDVEGTLLNHRRPRRWARRSGATAWQAALRCVGSRAQPRGPRRPTTRRRGPGARGSTMRRAAPP